MSENEPLDVLEMEESRKKSSIKVKGYKRCNPGGKRKTVFVRPYRIKKERSLLDRLKSVVK